MSAITAFIVGHNLGDIASVIGLPLTLLGLGLTLLVALRAKRAAQAASVAVSELRDTLRKLHTVADLSAVMASMEEIKRLHRAAAWAVLPDRYAMLRRTLISIRTSNPALNEEHQASLQNAVQHLRDFEGKVERALASKGPTPDPARLNQIVSAQMDKLEDLLAAIKLA